MVLAIVALAHTDRRFPGACRCGCGARRMPPCCSTCNSHPQLRLTLRGLKTIVGTWASLRNVVGPAACPRRSFHASGAALPRPRASRDGRALYRGQVMCDHFLTNTRVLTPHEAHARGPCWTLSRGGSRRSLSRDAACCFVHRVGRRGG